MKNTVLMKLILVYILRHFILLMKWCGGHPCFLNGKEEWDSVFHTSHAHAKTLKDVGGIITATDGFTCCLHELLVRLLYDFRKGKEKGEKRK